MGDFGVGKRMRPPPPGCGPGCRVGKRMRTHHRVNGDYATAVTSFRSPLRRVYMCVFLTRTCKGGSPPPPLQSRLPAENRPCGEAAPFSLRPRVGQDNTSLYCHALAPLTRPIPGPRPFGANASRCSKMLPAFLSFRCAPACGETARPIFFKPEQPPPLRRLIRCWAGKQRAPATAPAIKTVGAHSLTHPTKGVSDAFWRVNTAP